jgi:hypothetical protein
MRSTLTLTLLTLLASALAAPAPISNNDIANPDHILHLPATKTGNGNNNALSSRQEDRCDWDSFCLPEYQKCVKSCKSLSNSDW